MRHFLQSTSTSISSLPPGMITRAARSRLVTGTGTSPGLPPHNPPTLVTITSATGAPLAGLQLQAAALAIEQMVASDRSCSATFLHCACCLGTMPPTASDRCERPGYDPGLSSMWRIGNRPATTPGGPTFLPRLHRAPTLNRPSASTSRSSLASNRRGSRGSTTRFVPRRLTGF